MSAYSHVWVMAAGISRAIIPRDRLSSFKPDRSVIPCGDLHSQRAANCWTASIKAIHAGLAPSYQGMMHRCNILTPRAGTGRRYMEYITNIQISQYLSSTRIAKPSGRTWLKISVGGAFAGPRSTFYTHFVYVILLVHSAPDATALDS